MAAFEFRKKWENYKGTEKAGAQQFFLELCYLLDVPPPDPNSDKNYTFEKRVLLDGEYKFADVYKAGYFVLEFKRPGRNLQEAVWQATRYAIGLDNPPVVIVTDLWDIQIHTRFTGRKNHAIHLSLPSLEDPAKREILVWALTEPCRLEKFTTLSAGCNL